MTALAPVLLCLSAGCTSTGGGFTLPWQKADKKLETPKDSIALASASVARMPIEPGMKQKLDAAKHLFDEKKYADAEAAFNKIVRANTERQWWELSWLRETDPATGEDKDVIDAKRKGGNPKGRGVNPACEMALFFEAECQRMQKNFRAAYETYTKMLTEFPRSQYTPGACKGLFEIADYWLEPTRRQMDEYQEQLAGKRYFVAPAMYVHFTKDMPTLDPEGHATNILNTIRLHDIKGEMGKKALLYLGTIHFYRQDYKEADFYFTRLYEEYPNDKDAARAIKQSVICKQLVNGGSVYDPRAVEESKKLLMTSMGAYPELAKDEDWVRSQLVSINTQQADRDFKIAEFYQRTGHPGSAYFYYELVCRRYPNSEYATKAAQRKVDLKSKADREQQREGSLLTTPQPNPSVQAQQPAPIQVPPRALPPIVPNGPIR